MQSAPRLSENLERQGVPCAAVHGDKATVHDGVKEMFLGGPGKPSRQKILDTDKSRLKSPLLLKSRQEPLFPSHHNLPRCTQRYKISLASL